MGMQQPPTARFTWVPFMVELGQKLLAYEQRQSELVDLLREAGVKGGITDRDAEGNSIPLTEIDPFTFVALIHKYRDWHNRLPILSKLKSRLGVTAELPRDFEGVPIPNAQAAWFFRYKADRKPEDIPQLWALCRAVVAGDVAPDGFARTLALPQVGKGKLTQGMFWLNPERYLPIDNQTRPYLEKAGIQPEFEDFAGYEHILSDARDKFPGRKFWELSYEAWLDNQPAPRGVKYWIYAPGPDAQYWEEFCEKGIMAIGWDHLGDLREYADKKAIAQALRELDKEPESSKKNDATACHSFAREMRVGDVVFAKQGGSRILGHGVVESDYEFDDSRELYKHVRRMKWLKKGDWRVDEDSRFALKTLTDVTGYADFVKKLEVLVGSLPPSGSIRVEPYPIEQCTADTYLPVNLLQLWVEAIQRKRQAILYGPPGTGKTYLAERLARHLVSGGDGFIDLVQFHPAYSYEDFIQGIRPETTENGQVTYDLAPGRFLEFCQRAKGRQDTCVLIIDEINRANLARVFGELMYLLEYRKQSVPLAGGGTLSVPANVIILGTMNTADRSIALVDFALRRRFAFLEMAPDFNVLTQFQKKQGFDPSGLIAVLRDINTAIADKNFSLGVSFFLVPDLPKHVEQIWRTEIETYLEEYFFAQKETADKFRWAQVKDRILHG